MNTVRINAIEDLSLLPRRTIWGSQIQTANYTRGKISWVEFTTLNEKYNVGKDVAVENDEFPALEYFGIGRGSTYMKVLSDKSKDTVNYIHEPTDAALFFQMPFVLRTFDNDLSPSERAKYAIRALKVVNGIKYIAYYLKALDRTNTDVVAQIIIPETGDTPKEVKPITGDIRFLNPVATEPEVATLRTDGAYTNITSIMLSQMTSWDIDEMINAKKIMTGNSQLEITEIGLFSALPKTITSPTEVGNAPIQYTEAIKATLNTTSPHRILVNSYVGRNLSIEHDLGVNDPTNFQFIE